MLEEGAPPTGLAMADSMMIRYNEVQRLFFRYAPLGRETRSANLISAKLKPKSKPSQRAMIQVRGKPATFIDITKVRLGHYPAMSLQLARSKALVAIGSPFEASHAPTFPEARDQENGHRARNLKTRGCSIAIAIG